MMHVRNCQQVDALGVRCLHRQRGVRCAGRPLLIATAPS